MTFLDLLRPPTVVTINTRSEVIAGLTTFLTMAYILFVNPAIVGSGFELALTHALGTSSLSPQYQALVYTVKLGIAAGTAIAAAFGTLLMAFFARLPFAMAPGMGENSFIAFSVIPAFTTTLLNIGVLGPRAAEIALMVALTAVFIDGLIFLFTAWSGIRERIIKSISPNLAVGISVGIGLFITFIGLSLGGFVKPGVGTPVTFNVEAFRTPSSILAFIGLMLAIALYIYRVPGAFLITIIALTLVGIPLGLVTPPPSLVQLPTLSTSIIPNFPENIMWWIKLVSLAFPVALSLWMIEFFDGIGTIVGLSNRAGLVDVRGRPVNIERALYTDAMGTIVGALAGTTTTVIYVESAAGIESGGRTGLTSLITGLLFLAFLPLGPLAVMVPSFATAPVLILVGLMFISLIPKLNFSDLTEAIPAFVAIISIPLTYSIATGIGLAFITYTLTKIIAGRFREISVTTIIITLIFTIYFVAMLPSLH
ncbi:uracil permease [Vulcanisaeta sp. EB80]|uniref:NCS2 family permease n=1 Tax=Vulcanisaeta sp. EB80 TaxID=1650660 RepID=UPI0009BE56D2|nr:NCS2 family permease [Vulcanisaeta sp. EB80]PLC69000.1 uracil permease [Vulcanisaeta sp. EB80]